MEKARRDEIVREVRLAGQVGEQGQVIRDLAEERDLLQAVATAAAELCDSYGGHLPMAYLKLGAALKAAWL